MKTSIKTIDIQAKEWFDKVNGNSYFAGQIIVDYGMPSEKIFKMPFQYGYGTQYEQEAFDVLNKENITDKKRKWELAQEGIIVRCHKQEKCLKKDVKEFGL